MQRSNTNRLTAPGRELAKKGLLFQSVTAFFLIVLSAFFGSAEAVISIASGTLISLLPSALFAVFAFRYAGATQLKQVNQSFGQGAKLKMALTIILFVVAFAGLQAHPLFVLLGYAITAVSHVLAMFRHGT
ncbi:F0F1 ATP synthase subunit I [Alteromonas halophila]|uniref:F0F1 ATP synthase subunit I n=1 Tax=Alteromonas halophila TaxID=516698 RepID=A0A918JRX3_9ALTE|nr:F0F1 ATP synthase subunit I [Alteromonas halophila]